MDLWTLDAGLSFGLMAGLHVVGLASMFLARLDQSQSRHQLFHKLFLMCLVGVGLATTIAICNRSNCWVLSGSLFSLMAVGATADFGAAARTPEL